MPYWTLITWYCATQISFYEYLDSFLFCHFSCWEALVPGLCPSQWLDLYTKPLPFSDLFILLIDSSNSAPPVQSGCLQTHHSPPNIQNGWWTVLMMVFNLWSMVCCWAQVDLPLSLLCYHLTPSGTLFDRVDSHYFLHKSHRFST